MFDGKQRSLFKTPDINYPHSNERLRNAILSLNTVTITALRYDKEAATSPCRLIANNRSAGPLYGVDFAHHNPHAVLFKDPHFRTFTDEGPIRHHVEFLS